MVSVIATELRGGSAHGGRKATGKGASEASEGSSMNQGERYVQAGGTGAEAFTREETYAAARRPVSLAATLLPGAYTGHRSRLRRERPG